MSKYSLYQKLNLSTQIDPKTTTNTHTPKSLHNHQFSQTIKLQNSNCLSKNIHKYQDQLSQFNSKNNKTVRSNQEVCLNNINKLQRICLNELNSQLQNNLNEILRLLRRRKKLIQILKGKMCMESEKEQQLTNNDESIECILRKQVEDLFNNEGEVKRMIENVFVRCIKKQEQEQRGSNFWRQNKILQQQMDMQLNRLKEIDTQCQKNKEIMYEVCRKIDQIQSQLKILLLNNKNHKTSMQKASQLFTHKKYIQNQIQHKLYSIHNAKSSKIQSINQIINNLANLQTIRLNRIHQIQATFQFNSLKSNSIQMFQSLQQLISIKPKYNQILDIQQSLKHQLHHIHNHIQNLLSQILDAQSKQIKVYQKYYNMNLKKNYYTRILKNYQSQIDLIQQKQINIDKFRQYKQMIKAVIEEQKSLKLGLSKTKKTEKTFKSILRKIQSEDERNNEVLRLIERCSELRIGEQFKKQEIRQLESSKKKIQKQRMEIVDKIEFMMSQTDMCTYRQIGCRLEQIEEQMKQMDKNVYRLEDEVEQLNRQVVFIMRSIRSEYQDIIEPIFPQLFKQKQQNLKDLNNYIPKIHKKLQLIFSSKINIK